MILQTFLMKWFPHVPEKHEYDALTSVETVADYIVHCNQETAPLVAPVTMVEFYQKLHHLNKDSFKSFIAWYGLTSWQLSRIPPQIMDTMRKELLADIVWFFDISFNDFDVEHYLEWRNDQFRKKTLHPIKHLDRDAIVLYLQDSRNYPTNLAKLVSYHKINGIKEKINRHGRPD